MNLRALLLVIALSGCTPQQSASYMPMLGMGNSMANQAMNLYLQQERLQQQNQLLQQQQQRLRNQSTGYAP